MRLTLMRRFLGFLVLAVFVGTPALQLRCAIACALEDAADSGDACHHHHATVVDVPTLGDHHDCGEHATPTAVLTATRPLGADALPVLDAVFAMGTVTTTIVAAPIQTPPGDPPDRLAAPLRI
jgi:hypothetical protein